MTAEAHHHDVAEEVLIVVVKKVDFKAVQNDIAEVSCPPLGSEWTQVVLHDLG